MKTSLLLACTLLAGLAAPSSAEVRLPAVFSNHLVLQAAQPVAVWGWAKPGEKVTVALDAAHTASTTAQPDGTWRVSLPASLASDASHRLTVTGENTLTVEDVLIGDVWLCSGQSNMEMQLKGLHGQVDRADEEIAAAQHPWLRMFVHDDRYDIYAVPVPPNAPQMDRPGHWIVCSPETAATFTAIGYFVAREIHQTTRQPVGLLHASVGGTPIEAWTSLSALQAKPAFQPLLADWQKQLAGYDPAAVLAQFDTAKMAWLKARAAARAAGQPDPKTPTPFKNLGVMAPAVLFNSSIAPLIPYTLRGVLWYQGERNAAGPFTGLYGEELRTLIADWRQRWGRDDLYFAWVQIANIQKPQTLPSEPKGWGVQVRDGMRRALDVPHTGMAIAIDLGGPTAGHPTNKADFGRRLAAVVLHDVYGVTANADYTGPLYRSLTKEGASLALTFDHAAGLRAADGELKGFAIAGADRKFVWAEARIEGDRVIVSSAAVKAPEAVRYGWAANPIGNLVNAAKIPASPFRTDDWE